MGGQYNTGFGNCQTNVPTNRPWSRPRAFHEEPSALAILQLSATVRWTPGSQISSGLAICDRDRPDCRGPCRGPGARRSTGTRSLPTRLEGTAASVSRLSRTHLRGTSHLYGPSHVRGPSRSPVHARTSPWARRSAVPCLERPAGWCVASACPSPSHASCAPYRGGGRARAPPTSTWWLDPFAAGVVGCLCVGSCQSRKQRDDSWVPQRE